MNMDEAIQQMQGPGLNVPPSAPVPGQLASMAWLRSLPNLPGGPATPVHTMDAGAWNSLARSGEDPAAFARSQMRAAPAVLPQAGPQAPAQGPPALPVPMPGGMGGISPTTATVGNMAADLQGAMQQNMPDSKYTQLMAGMVGHSPWIGETPWFKEQQKKEMSRQALSQAIGMLPQDNARMLAATHATDVVGRLKLAQEQAEQMKTPEGMALLGLQQKAIADPTMTPEQIIQQSRAIKQLQEQGRNAPVSPVAIRAAPSLGDILPPNLAVKLNRPEFNPNDPATGSDAADRATKMLYNENPEFLKDPKVIEALKGTYGDSIRNMIHPGLIGGAISGTMSHHIGNPLPLREVLGAAVPGPKSIETKRNELLRKMIPNK